MTRKRLTNSEVPLGIVKLKELHTMIDILNIHRNEFCYLDLPKVKAFLL